MSLTLGIESEVRSMLTLSETSVLHSQRHWRNTPLHERCETFDMVKLKEAFDNAYMKQLFPDEFRVLLREVLSLEYDDDEFKLLVLKINTNRDGVISWDELVSHLLLGYFGNDTENQRENLERPILGVPHVMRSMHRQCISRICFCPDVSKDRSTDPLQGAYITASRDGMINWWSLNMSLLRTAYSTSPHLKVRTTWVTDLVCMPDVNIIVTSSTERDLRFYDCTAKTFTLKMIISSWEYMIYTMHYHFHKDENEKCILICGDVGGNVRVLLFSPINRGPFRSQAICPLIRLRHSTLQKRPYVLPEMQLVEFQKVHSDLVRQVWFYASLHWVVSCATCPDSLLMCDVAGSKSYKMFRVEKGIHCFVVDEESHVLVTGGPDCVVRVWNPFVSSKCTIMLHGHHAGIKALVLQRKGQIIYSMSRDRIIKVWDVLGQNCIQTYVDVPSEIGESVPISTVYNPATRQFHMAAIKIAVITLDEQLNPHHTDGFTHTRAVSKILYNPLFKIVLTFGRDSIIINWNPLTGQRNLMIRDAHTTLLHGELIPVEITAACFDPGFQLLVTGARNGALRVWNFNTGTCLRNMNIEHMAEVTNVFWIESRIFAVGWNRHVTEFEDTGTTATGKAWETRHSDDVLAAAARSPLSLATSSYNSELVFWKLDTGQPYRRFSCMDPTLRMKIQYQKPVGPAPAVHQTTKPGASRVSLCKVTSSRASISKSNIHRPSMVVRSDTLDPTEAVKKAHARRVSMVSMPVRAQHMRQLAVHAMIFLETRPFHMHVASMVLSLENGQVQCWSDHPAGGYQGSFQGIHTVGDYVSTFATDVKNEYLFTGTTVGYVKVWLMSNYLTNEPVHVNMPKLRLEFPFLWRDRIEGRAKRSVRDQPLPLLLNSYRAHMRCITTIAYIDEQKLVLSGSSDYSVRIWRLTGEYLQTLGTFVPWTLAETRFPPDVCKVASFTTFKVWRGGYVSRFTPGKVEEDKLRDITEQEISTKTYGQLAPEPLLGHYFKLPRRPEYQRRIRLDDSLPVIPLFEHLRMASTVPVRRPPTPELVCQTRLKKETIQKKHLDTRPSLAPSRLSKISKENVDPNARN